VVASMLTGRPVKWTEDRAENLTSTAFARDYVMRGEIAASREGRILAIRTSVLADHGAVQRGRRTDAVPGGVLRRLHRQLRHRGGARHDDRRLHQQGTRRRGVLLFVPHHRGRLSRRAAGRLPGARAGHGPGRAAAAQPAPAGTVPVHLEDRLDRTTRATTSRPCARRCAWRTTTGCAASRRSGASAAS
jgi:hypothetical protein